MFQRHVPVGQFFTDGAGTSRTSAKPLAFDPQALRFAEAFIRLNDRALRNSILDMVEAMARKSPGRGHDSRAYLIVPRGGMVTVTSGDGIDITGQPKQPKNVSEEVGIQRRDDVTIDMSKS
jgi:hypothetical protein